ncbi:MAG: hypothetical protein IBJ03_18780 [Gemmatimonadaceae bacterium]|nr:hypothetical protein [Gemmatimonadaceae bacterium]
MLLPQPFSRRTRSPSHAHAEPDATGSPFILRPTNTPHRPETSDPRDFREQADGAP